MSRRARLESEKLKQMNDELLNEDAKTKAQMDRIYAPLVWKKLPSGIRIQDLKPNYHQDVLRIIQEDYIGGEILCENTNMKDDQDSVKSFLNKVIFNLKDQTSIIALDESLDENENEPIAGFMIFKVIHKADYGRVFSRIQLSDGEAYKKIIELTAFLNRKSDIFGEFQCTEFIRYYLLCVRPQYRGRALGRHLMLTGIEISRSLNIDVIMGIFPTFKLQKLAKIVGMKEILAVNYVDWRDKSGEMIFPDPGAGNYTCAVMAGRVPPHKPADPVQLHEIKIQEELAQAKTREERRKIKEKKPRNI